MVHQAVTFWLTCVFQLVNYLISILLTNTHNLIN